MKPATANGFAMDGWPKPAAYDPGSADMPHRPHGWAGAQGSHALVLQQHHRQWQKRIPVFGWQQHHGHGEPGKHPRGKGMNIIGITEVGDGYHKQKAYVAIISHQELEKVADKARLSGKDKVPELRVGDQYQIGEGHDFRAELVGAIKVMQDAYIKFAKVAPTAARFAGLVLTDQELSEASE